MYGVIYALYYRNRVIYIGQTKRFVTVRFRSHFYNFKEGRDRLIYHYMKNITTPEKFYDDIKIRILKRVPIKDLDSWEIKYMKYCIERGVKICNNCSIAVSLKKEYNMIL